MARVAEPVPEKSEPTFCRNDFLYAVSATEKDIVVELNQKNRVNQNWLLKGNQCPDEKTERAAAGQFSSEARTWNETRKEKLLPLDKRDAQLPDFFSKTQTS